MDLAEALRQLEAAGTAQNCKVYARHGATPPMFGVSYAVLHAMTKRAGMDQKLADGLWATGNYDARILATMVADPEAMTSKQIDAWVADARCHPISDAFFKLVVRTPHAAAKAAKWRASKDEWTSATGWLVTGGLAEAGELDDKAMGELIAVIEKGIHASPNRTRHSMVLALIMIGSQPSMTETAVAAAKRIGKVEVDHGETDCKTPEPIGYIKKVLEYRAAKAAKAAAKGAVKKATVKKAAAKKK